MGFPRHVRRSSGGANAHYALLRPAAGTASATRSRMGFPRHVRRSLSGGATRTPHSRDPGWSTVRGPRPAAGTASATRNGWAFRDFGVIAEWRRHAHSALLRFFFHVATMRSFSCCRHAVFLMLPPCGLSHVAAMRSFSMLPSCGLSPCCRHAVFLMDVLVRVDRAPVRLFEEPSRHCVSVQLVDGRSGGGSPHLESCRRRVSSVARCHCSDLHPS